MTRIMLVTPTTLPHVSNDEISKRAQNCLSRRMSATRLKTNCNFIFCNSLQYIYSILLLLYVFFVYYYKRFHDFYIHVYLKRLPICTYIISITGLRPFKI